MEVSRPRGPLAVRGLTVARLQVMVEACQQRKARELREQAIAVALAMHEPKGIEKHIRAPRAGARSDDGEWVTERWWGRGKERWKQTA